MTNVTAAYLGTLVGFVAIGLLSFWYVKPYVVKQPLSLALTILIVPHVFRYMALQLFSAQATGLVISDAGRNFIAYGDVAAAILALIALGAIHRQASWAMPAVWLFAIFGVTDLTLAVGQSLIERLSETSGPLLFLVTTIYIPILFMSLALLFWQLLTRRKEAVL
ncbi:MAG: hypothetical protein AAF485_15055 [Chloroflexota bacterium]